MDYCRDIKFEEKPDYNYLRRILKDLFNRNGFEYDYVYDWNIQDKQRKKRVQSHAPSNREGIIKKQQEHFDNQRGGHYNENMIKSPNQFVN
jgi:casein kinase I family protein HRR25